MKKSMLVIGLFLGALACGGGEPLPASPGKFAFVGQWAVFGAGTATRIATMTYGSTPSSGGKLVLTGGLAVAQTGFAGDPNVADFSVTFGGHALTGTYLDHAVFRGQLDGAAVDGVREQ